MKDAPIPTLPPIAQLMLTVQFAPAAINMTVRDYANLSSVLGEGRPVFQQIGRAGPMPFDANDLLIDTASSAPRIQMLSETLGEQVLFQDDRITCAWNRVAPLDHDPQYPGFFHVFDQLDHSFDLMRQYLTDNGYGVIAPTVGEVIYTDAFAVADRANPRWKLEDVFSFYKSHEDFIFNDINLTFRKYYLTGLTGHSETKVAGPFIGANGDALINLQTTIRFDLSTHEDTRSAFGLARDAARDIFDTLVKPTAFPKLVG